MKINIKLADRRPGGYAASSTSIYFHRNLGTYSSIQISKFYLHPVSTSEVGAVFYTNESELTNNMADIQPSITWSKWKLY